ncbi:MAG: geranyl transferase [Wenzhouxiangella sp.]|nr:MAG: geranyl transferase [Wenzhouxiangella sp.]
MSFSTLVRRVEIELERRIDAGVESEGRLSQAMRYAVFNGGKRLRPLLVYACGETLGLTLERLDAPACAVELIHCYSLVHDDLPAMDDDDLRRGRPTAHLAFDEATAILAGDALQALAFQILAQDGRSDRERAAGCNMISELASACGVSGMAGGQARDLELEHKTPDQATVETMFRMKTGALIRAAVMMPTALAPDLPPAQVQALREFGEDIGLAFQIRDDLLDVEGNTEIIGKQAGADQALGKANWPALFGIEGARRRIMELDARARASLERIEGDTSGLRRLADRLLHRAA